MSINVLHVYKSFYPDSYGGVEQAIYQLCKDPHINSKVLCLSDKDQVDSFDEIEVHRCKTFISMSSCPISISAIFKFIKLAKWADIIHYHYPYPFADLLSLFAPKKKSIVTYHSDIIKQKFLRLFYYPLEQWFLSKVDIIIATSPNYLKSSPNLLKYKDKTKIITIGIDPQQYKKITKNNYKELFGKFFLFVGQLRYYKGLHILLEALQDSNQQLVIAGNGLEFNRLMDMKVRLKLDNVHFLGKVTEQEKLNLLDACYCVILPSHLRSEALGIALIEGALFGKPLICANIQTGTDYININNQTGYVVPPNNANALCAAIIKLAQNEQTANIFGKNAKNRFEYYFTAEKMRDEYFAVYNEL